MNSKKLFFKYQILLFIFTLGLISFHEVKGENKMALDIQSCRNLSYKEGINVFKGKNNSFKIYSTSVVYLKYGRQKLGYAEVSEAKLRSKSQIAKFMKLLDSSNYQNFNFVNFPISVNNRPISSEIKLKNRLKNISFGSNKSISGLIQHGICKEKEDFIMATYLITDKTIKAADSITNY